MNTKEALEEIKASGRDATFQIECDEMPRHEIRVNSKDLFELKEKVIIEKFGEQNWKKIKFFGYIATYCPDEIAEELRLKKQRMYNHFANYGCD